MSTLGKREVTTTTKTVEQSDRAVDVIVKEIRGLRSALDHLADALEANNEKAEQALKVQAERAAKPTLRVAELLIETASRKAFLGLEELALSAKEFDLLVCLAHEPTKVFTKQELLRDVWDYGVAASTRTLDTHASRLRRKLGPSGRRWIVNVWGVGYRLTDRVEEVAA